MKLPRGLSVDMRDVLIEHVHGPVPVDNTSRADPHRRRTVVALVRRGLVAYEHREPKQPRRLRWRIGLGYHKPRKMRRPRASVLTDEGRELLCTVLADHADALVRAGVVAEMLQPAETTKDLISRLDNSAKPRERLLAPVGTPVPPPIGDEDEYHRMLPRRSPNPAGV